MFWVLVILMSCNNAHTESGENNCKKDTVDDVAEEDTMPVEREINTVLGHEERDTIWGNFTGKGVDTLFVICEIDTTLDFGNSDMCKYFAVSSNKSIPKIELYGCCDVSPKLVFEGDLDQNGIDEWGCLHTWMMSQWRYYRVFTLKDGEWRYLIQDDHLDTPMWFRMSGCDIVEPANKPGYVKINYGTFGETFEQLDTVVKATHNKITDCYE